MSDVQQCSSCAYWFPYKRLFGREPVRGLCRSSPPVPNIFFGMSWSSSYQPVTLAIDWCAEYEEAK